MRDESVPPRAAAVRELRPRTAVAPPDADHGPPLERNGQQWHGANRVERAVRAHLTLVWQVLRRAGLRAADADDAAQDVFWVFSQRSCDVSERATRAFLITTALRIASDRRKLKWNRVMAEPLDVESWSHANCSPEEQLELWRKTQVLDQLLATMSKDEREIFILAEVEEMTRREVAESLGIPEGTAASRLRRARDSFERLLRRLQPTREQINVR